jgi:signal transduction histidine kinase
MQRLTLRRRLYWLFVEFFVLFLLVAGSVSFISFSRFRRNAIEERLLLARTVAHYLDATMSTALQNLGRLASQLPSLGPDAIPPMHAYRIQSVFRESIAVFNARGEPILADPSSTERIAPARLTPQESVTTLFPRETGRVRQALALIQPFQRGGATYYLVAEMNPLGSIMSTFLQTLGTEPDTHVFVADANGRVVAAPDQKQLFRTIADAPVLGDRIAAHRPYVSESDDRAVPNGDDAKTGFLTVMVPLRFAPWGVVVQQHERRAFAALYASQGGFLAAGILLVLMGLMLSRAVLKSVITPIHSLSEQAERLSRGDLATPISVQGDHEIDVLAGTMDGARKRLAETLGELQGLNESLERQVASRTQVLAAQYDNLRLLHAVSQIAISEREPERFVPDILRRIAEHYGFPAVALVTFPLDSSPVVYTYPGEASVPAFDDPDLPDGWDRRALKYQDRVQAVLIHPRLRRGNQEVMEALQRQLAVSLQGLYLLNRTLMQDAQRRALVRRLLDAGEEERRRIARELHDEISQLLTVVQLSLEGVEGDTTEMRKARDLLTQTQREVHRIIYDLRPSLLDDLGLSAAIKSHAANHLASLNTNLEIEEGLRLPPEAEIATFRIYQEIVTNILRHANAENVSVELYAAGDEIVLRVEDDGIGFSPEAKAEGVGIVGMRERAALVNGSIGFTSEAGMGTCVTLKVPVRS